jgi:hypothetical protein
MRERLCWLLLMLLPGIAWADDSPLGMSYIRTSDAEFIYFAKLGYLVPHAERSFVNSLHWQHERFGWTPSGPVYVFLKDGGDYGNAYLSPAPFTEAVLDVAPDSHAFETAASVDRLYTTLNHELVHASQEDLSSPQERFWRGAFFGKVDPQGQYPETILYNYLTVPRFIAPRWYLEGGAVFMETWMDGGLGRAQGGYDEMVFRALVRDDAKFYDPLALVSTGVRVDFQVGANAYLYGTRFMTWLAYNYSPEQVVAWIRRDAGSKRYYYDQFEFVFGIPLEQAWQHWIDFEHEFQKKNLAAVRQYPITPYKPLTTAGIGSISRVYFDAKSGLLYGGFRYPGVVEHIGAINTADGTVRRIADIKHGALYSVTSLAFDPDSQTLFYTNNNLSHRDLLALDVKSGESRLLIEGARIGDMVFNPIDRSLIGVRHDKGIAALVRVAYPYKDWEEIRSFPYEYVPSDLAISPDGTLLSASVGEPNGDQFVRVWKLADMLAGKVTVVSEFRFGQSVPESFVFSRDGKYLYGSSYYTGVSNIFRYEVASGKITALSNAEIGFFRPTPLPDGRMIVLAYTGSGFVPATIDPRPLEDVSAIKFLGTALVEKHPIITTWQVPPASSTDAPIPVLAEGPYLPLDNVSLANAYPVLQGYKNAMGLGYHLNFTDPVQFAKLGITGAYTPIGPSPEAQRSHFDVEGEYLDWRAQVAYNLSDFYDLFGPTKISRKGDLVKLGYDDYLIYDGTRKMIVKYDLAYLNNIDTLPDAQNVTSAFTRLTKEQVEWNYTDLRRSIGAVDDEKGISWAAVGTEYQADGGSVSQLRGSLNLGFDTPVPHASIWVRLAAGASNGSKDDPLSDFYFGGFGNNYVDKGSIKRFEDYDSYPGFSIDDIGARRFGRAMLEANLPPLVFDSTGAPGFYVNWLRTSVFVADLATSHSDVAQITGSYQTIGAQCDLHFSVLHWNELTLSIGYAVGFHESRRASDEFMISLKIL